MNSGSMASGAALVFPDLSGGALNPLLPFLILSVGALVLLLLDSLFAKRNNLPWAMISSVLPLLALATYATRWPGQSGTTVFGPMYIEDPFASFVGILVCIATLFGMLLSETYLKKMGRYRGDYFALLAFSASGMVLFASTTEFLTLFLGLELLSIPVYILTGFLRRDQKSLEAAMKYFLLGAFSSALFLFGGAFIYGATGTTDLAVALRSAPQSPMLQIGFVLLLSGFLFKAATVPFHMWTPDVYEGAPTAVTAFMATSIKAASFGALGRLLYNAAPVTQILPIPDMLWWIAVLTMTVGNFAALTQSNIKRMLAYSSIAHAGYMTVGLVSFASSGDTEALAGVLYYLLAYTLMNIGAFGVVILWSEKGTERLEIGEYAGLGWKTPALGLAMTIFMISLAGIPPAAGFFGKYYIFRNAVEHGYVSLVVLGVLNSALSVYYYLRVLVALYMRPATREFTMDRSVVVGSVVAFCGLALLWIGIAPDTVLPGVPALVGWVRESVLTLR
ncbi:MAG: NADH-quinone oxidoreductase subunit N [Candidatus Eisenbacteria bacterium]|nr:NADH-quinone oxidoreductase subunit N [Candidatus Eisenbacteria bacterium]